MYVGSSYACTLSMGTLFRPLHGGRPYHVRVRRSLRHNGLTPVPLAPKQHPSIVVFQHWPY